MIKRFPVLPGRFPIPNREPFPNKKYQIIYVDPPWGYRDRVLAGNRGLAVSIKRKKIIGYVIFRFQK